MERSRRSMRRIERSIVMSHLLEAYDCGDCGGEAIPVVGLDAQLLLAGARERIELRPPIVFRLSPLGGDPSLLLELVQGGVEGAVADLQRVPGDLLQALADLPAVHG